MKSRNLRVAFVVSRFPVCSETFILQQVHGLLKRQLDIRIFAAKHLTSESIPEEFEIPEELVAGSGTVKGRQFGRPAAIRRLSRFAVTSPRRTGRAITQMRRQRGELARVLRLAEELDAAGPFDVLHCHYGPIGVTTQRARDLLGWQTPFTVTFHGYDLSRGSAIDDAAYAALFSSAAALLPVSEAWHEVLVERGAPPERTVTHRMGVNLDRFRFAPRSSDAPLQLLSVCRLVEKKGLSDGIRAIALLRERNVDVRYRIVGDGPLAAELSGLVEDLGLSEVVTLEGWQPPEIVRERLLRSQVLLAPSVTARDGDREGIPVSIMEAMATGLPVVSTWHSGIPELIADGESGFLVREHDPEALADRIEQLAESASLCAAMGACARERVQELHDQEALDDELAEQLRELASRAPTECPESQIR